MSKYQDFLNESKSKINFYHETKDGEIILKTWPDPTQYEIIGHGVGGDKFGSEANTSYMNGKTSYVVEIDALDIGLAGDKGKWELYGNGITKKGTFKTFEEIDGILNKIIPVESKKIWASIDKQIPKKIGNFTRSVLPYDTEISYEGKNKSGEQISIILEEIDQVVSGGTSTYIMQTDDDEYEGNWKSFKDMISIVKKA